VGLLPVARSEQLVDLTGLAFGEKWRGLMPSAGGCDEFIRLYLFQQEVTPEQLQTFEG
jgi:ADP-sugar diphosphatase